MNPSRQEIEELITILAKAFGLDVAASLRQCEKESSFNCDAVHPVSGARGLFQLMPDTARQMGVNRMEPAENVYGGLKYMRWLKETYAFTDRQAYAAYDWGGGNVHHVVAQHPEDWEVNLPEETRKYVAFICGPAA